MISLRYRRIAWLIALLAVISAGLVAHFSRARFVALDAEVRNALAVREAIAATLTLLLDAETAQRGYLLTGDAQFLDPHESARQKIGPQLETLRVLTKGESGQDDGVRRIEKLAEQKLAVTEETIGLRRQGRAAEAIGIVQSGRGKRLMDAIRVEAAAMQDRALKALEERREATLVAQQRMNIALLAGLGVGVMLAVGGLAMARRDMEAERIAKLKVSESEEAFRLLADNASDLIRILADDGSHLYVSPSSKRLLGYRAEELRAMAPESLLPQEDRQAFLPGHSDKTSRGTQSIIHRMRSKNGELRWFETRIAPALYQPDGRPRIHMSSRDITGRKQAEDELRRQKALLQSIVTNMGDGLVVVDTDRKVVMTNPAMDPYEKPFPPEDGPLSRALKGESADGMEMIMRDTSGGARSFSVTARPIRDGDAVTGAVAVFHDITALRQAEHDLIESEQRWRVLSEASFEGMAVTRGGHILDTNATLAGWLGRDPSELVGLEGLTVFAPEDRERVRILSGNEATRAYEARLLRQDGTTFPVEVRGRSVVFRGRQVRIAVIRDITERKAQEAELARRAERLRELSLRDELTRLYNRRGFLELARQQLLLAARSRRHAAVFYADLNGMKLINDELGHEMGDRALVETAAILVKVFRASDILARLGGDEFAVLAVECDAAGVAAASARLHKLVEEHNLAAGNAFRLSVSVGAAVYDPASPPNLETLMQQADERMYEVKRARSDRPRERRDVGGVAEGS